MKISEIFQKTARYPIENRGDVSSFLCPVQSGLMAKDKAGK